MNKYEKFIINYNYLEQYSKDNLLSIKDFKTLYRINMFDLKMLFYDLVKFTFNSRNKININKYYLFEKNNIYNEKFMFNLTELFFKYLNDDELYNIYFNLVNNKRINILKYDINNSNCNKYNGLCINDNNTISIYLYLKNSIEDSKTLIHECGHAIGHIISPNNLCTRNIFREIESFFLELLFYYFIDNKCNEQELCYYLYSNRISSINDLLNTFYYQKIIYNQLGDKINLKRINDKLNKEYNNNINLNINDINSIINENTLSIFVYIISFFYSKYLFNKYSSIDDKIKCFKDFFKDDINISSSISNISTSLKKEDVKQLIKW